MTNTAKTKGVGFANVRAFVDERFGGAGWAAVESELVAEDRRELESIVPVGWYSLPLYARLIRAVDRVHGGGDLSLVVQLGRFEAERDLTTIHRVFLRLANPAFVLEKTGEYWRRFHDTGHWVITRDTPTRVTAYLDDWGTVDAALCREVVGYLVRVWELVGAKAVRLDHAQCRARGDARCQFLGRWGEEAARPEVAVSPPKVASPPAASGALPTSTDRVTRRGGDETTKHVAEGTRKKA